MNAYRQEIGRQEVLVGLDVGTSKVLAVSARVSIEGNAEIIGYGEARYSSGGLDKGVVVNVDDTVQAIKKAISNMEMMAPCGDISAVYTGLTGEHVRGDASRGIVAVKGGEVTDEDIRLVLDPAQVVPNRAVGKRILHITPKGYTVDGQSNIREPRGMLASRLEADVHVFSCEENIARNLERCINNAGYEVLGTSLSQIAVGKAVLADEEKEQGVCLVDIGAGTMEIAVFIGGAVRHTAMIPLCGCEATNDIALVLQISRLHAERIKTEYGSALAQMVAADETLPPIQMAGKSVNIHRQLLAQIIEARYRELFMLIEDVLTKSGYQERVPMGMVLTGGAACMNGLKVLAEESFHRHVRILLSLIPT